MPAASANGHASLSHVPIIDISKPDKDTPAKLVDAAATYGFVYIKSVGLELTREIVDHVFALSRRFFQSPQVDKAGCAIPEYGNRGWACMHSETLDPKHQKRGDFKESADSVLSLLFAQVSDAINTRAFNFGEFVDGRAQQPMPKSLAPNEADLSRFADLCHGLCIKLLKLFALGLNVGTVQILIGGDVHCLSDDRSIRTTAERIGFPPAMIPQKYPAIQASTSDYDATVDIRAGAHSDYGSLTLLFQRPGQPGLDILTPQTIWAPLAVSPPGTEDDAFPPILVNVADLLSHWTNGLLKSTLHRVVFPDGGGENRYSIAYFCHPANDTELVPVPSEIVRTMPCATKDTGRGAGEGRGKGAKGAITAEEHLNSRLATTYGWGKQADPIRD